LAGPVFIAGLDHSGKTALRLALAAGAGIHLVRRFELWTRLWPAHRRDGRTDRLVHALTRGHGAGMDLDREGLVHAAEAGTFGDVVREIGRQLCQRSGARRWGVQEALLELVADGVLRELPEARIVHVVRDPRERYGAMLDAGATGRAGVGAETAAWIDSTRAALRMAAAHPAEFKIVRYEALLRDREATLRDVCDFIGAPCPPRLVAEGGNGDADEPRTGAVRLDERDVAFIQARAGSELVALGYHLEPVGPRTGILRHRLVDAVRWRLGRLAWRRRTRQLGSRFGTQGG
jgi:hypothetical protein